MSTTGTDQEKVEIKNKVDNTANEVFQIIRDAALKEFPNDKDNQWLFVSRVTNAVWVVCNPQLVPILQQLKKG